MLHGRAPNQSTTEHDTDLLCPPIDIRHSAHVGIRAYSVVAVSAASRKNLDRIVHLLAEDKRCFPADQLQKCQTVAEVNVVRRARFKQSKQFIAVPFRGTEPPSHESEAEIRPTTERRPYVPYEHTIPLLDILGRGIFLLDDGGVRR